MGLKLSHILLPGLALAALGAGITAPAQTGDPVEAFADAVAKSAAPFWSHEAGRLRHVPSGVAFPLRAGDLTFARIATASHKGTGLDDVVEWRGGAGAAGVISAFVFRPTLPDAGLTAAMTHILIRDGFGEGVTVKTEERAAGGVANAVRVIRYEKGVLNGAPMWTGAAFLRTGPWIVALRISGPAARQAQLEQALTDLLGRMDYGTRYKPYPFHNITLSQCISPPGPPMPKQLAMDGNAAGAYGILINRVDSGANATGRDGKPVVAPSRVPDHFCVTVLGTEPRRKQLLLVPLNDGPPSIPLTDLKALLILNDAGGMMEFSRASNGRSPYYLLSHGVGEARLVAAFDGPLPNETYLQVVAGRFPPVKDPNSVIYAVDAEDHLKVVIPTKPAGNGGTTQ